MRNFISFILAAGKGSRIAEATDIPKVLLPLEGKPLAKYAVDLVSRFDITPIVVVAYKKELVMDELGGYIYAEQVSHHGTGGAVMTALQKYQKSKSEFSSDVDSVLVLQGDDTAFLKDETIKNLMDTHRELSSVITLLTTKKENPTGLGRIIRDEIGEFTEIVEEKNATEDQKLVNEINTGVWAFNLQWLIENIDNIEANPLTNEYYATDLVGIAVSENCNVSTFTCGNDEVFGINTIEQYEEAKRRIKSKA